MLTDNAGYDNIYLSREKGNSPNKERKNKMKLIDRFKKELERNRYILKKVEDSDDESLKDYYRAQIQSLEMFINGYHTDKTE